MVERDDVSALWDAERGVEVAARGRCSVMPLVVASFSCRHKCSPNRFMRIFKFKTFQPS